MHDFALENRKFIVDAPGNPLSEGDLTNFESKIRIKLPSQLRSFYHHWNGGLPCPLDVPESKSLWIRLYWNQLAKAARLGPATSLCSLFRINDRPSVDFFNMWNNFKENIPRDVLCFAPDPGGSLFLIGIKEYNLGKIFFWESSYQANIGEGEFPSYDNIAFVANSFTEFLLALREEPDEGESLEAWVKRVYPA